GTHVAEPAFFHAPGSTLWMPVGADDGLWLWHLADSLEPLDKVHLVTTKPALWMTAAQMGVGVLAAWSTDADCYMTLANSLAPGRSQRIAATCAQPHIAIDQKTQAGVMVFEGRDGVRLMHIHGTQFGGDAPLVRPWTRAPRTVFDGTRFWVSYLDAR